jgi:hypothetical protein
VTIEGLVIWGSPVTRLGDVPFGIPNEDEREHLYSTIPPDTDILVTHGPPLGVLDYGGGCAALRRAVLRVNLNSMCSATCTAATEQGQLSTLSS